MGSIGWAHLVLLQKAIALCLGLTTNSHPRHDRHQGCFLWVEEASAVKALEVDSAHFFAESAIILCLVTRLWEQLRICSWASLVFLSLLLSVVLPFPYPKPCHLGDALHA